MAKPQSSCLLSAALVLWVCGVSRGYPYFEDRIPNGKRVPHPCKPNELWEGVGHFNVKGGGHRNPFGIHFQEAGNTWTAELCGQDSDGDGRTNGEELGDGACTWQPGDLPPDIPAGGLSHPGICEPLDSETCKGKELHLGLFRTQEEWMADACMRGEFQCPGLNDTDVKNVTLKYPSTAVPAQETTYMCAVFDFPESEADVHMIATTPIIDNRQVMHHILLYGCQGDVDGTRNEPYECNMAGNRQCTTLLSAWTIGVSGDCFHANTGVRLGVNGYKTFVLQFHWNNPQRLGTYEDGSGMVLHYTPNKRLADSSILWLGNDKFEIPPRHPTVSVEGACTNECTRTMFQSKVHVVKALNHMHYLGKAQSIAHLRDGQLLRYITQDARYSYDSPRIYEFEDPIEVLPGDELRTTCEFSSLTRSQTTTYGDSTQEEMCFGFLYFYPANAVRSSYCVSKHDYTYCDASSMKGCNMWRFGQNIEDNGVYEMIAANCSYHTACTTQCKDAIAEARQREACLREENRAKMEDIAQWWSGSDPFTSAVFLGGIAPCDIDMYRDQHQLPEVTPSDEPCVPAEFQTALLGHVAGMVAANCTYYGACYQECRDAITEARAREPCMRLEHRKQMLQFAQPFIAQMPEASATFLGGLASCELEMFREENPPPASPAPSSPPDSSTPPTTGGAQAVSRFLPLTMTAAAAALVLAFFSN